MRKRDLENLIQPEHTEGKLDRRAQRVKPNELNGWQNESRLKKTTNKQKNRAMLALFLFL